MTNSGAVAVVLSPSKEKKQLFPERSHFHRRARFCTNGTILCVCSHDHYYSMYLSILQVLQACVQDEEKKMHIRVSLMVMLPIRHLNINIKHQSTNSHREIYCYWLVKMFTILTLRINTWRSCFRAQVERWGGAGGGGANVSTLARCLCR